MEHSQEILIVDDGQGHIIREIQRNTLTLVLFHLMKETFAILTSVNPHDTVSCMGSYCNICVGQLVRFLALLKSDFFQKAFEIY
jgi:hypothetical protein